jgi:hypothetical protein
MPELSRFFGIVIRMFYSDHEPAHSMRTMESTKHSSKSKLSQYSAGRCRDGHSRWCLNGLRSIARNFAMTGGSLATENRLTKSSPSIEVN